MSTVLTPNMNLTLPVPTSEPGPAWAFEINTALGLVDSHDHTAGKGVPITPQAININSVLSFNGNNAAQIGAVLLAAQSVDPLSNFSVYAKGVDLYYTDGNGNHIQLTTLGGVAGTRGSIGSLVAPASATYIAGNGTFQFQQGVGIAGNGDFGTMILRYPGSYPTPAGTNWIALEVPSSIAAGYAVTLPAAPPASAAFLTMDNSGNIHTNVSTTQGIVQTMLAPRVVSQTVAAGGVAISPSSGFFSSVSATPVPVTNMLVNISTTGRPVALMLQPDNAGGSYLRCTAAANPSVSFYVFRNGVQISQSLLQLSTLGTASVIGPVAIYNFPAMTINGGLIGEVGPGFATTSLNGPITTTLLRIDMPPGNLLIDTPAAGGYTYTFQVSASAGSTVVVNECALVAYEL